MVRVASTIAAYRIAKSPGNCNFCGENTSILSSVNNVLTSSATIRMALKDFIFGPRIAVPYNSIGERNSVRYTFHIENHSLEP